MRNTDCLSDISFAGQLSFPTLQAGVNLVEVLKDSDTASFGEQKSVIEVLVRSATLEY